jgi:hypothetical protein
MSVTTENLLVTMLVEYFNQNQVAMGLPVPVRNNEHEETGEALWLQPNSGERKSQAYIGGSYKGNFPFTMCYQYTNPNNQDGRRAILDLPFYRIAAYFEALNDKIKLEGDGITVEVSAEMVTHPAMSWASEDGQTIEHSATFQLEYHVRRPITISIPGQGG